jgi:hypothetical protein
MSTAVIVAFDASICRFPCSGTRQEFRGTSADFPVAELVKSFVGIAAPSETLDNFPYTLQPSCLKELS